MTYVGLVRWVMGDYNRVSRGYEVDLLSQQGLQVFILLHKGAYFIASKAPPLCDKVLRSSLHHQAFQEL